MKNRFFPLIISLLLTGVLLFTVKDFMRYVIVEPLLYIVWFVSLVLGSLPQGIFWVIFIIIALVIASKSLTTGKSSKPKDEVVALRNQGSVTTWFRLLERANTQEYSKWDLARTLRKFTWEILSTDEQLTAHKEKDPWQEFTSSLPPEISAYFEAGLASFQPTARRWSRLPSNNPPRALELEPERIVEYLEKQLDPLREG